MNYKTNKHNISLVLSILITFSGCSIKSDDSIGMKALKHTINSPMYLVLGIGAAASYTGGAVGKTVSNITETSTEKEKPLPKDFKNMTAAELKEYQRQH